MKIFQIVDGFCYWDATPQHPTLRSTEELYSPEIIFVEAPDYVFVGWGFDETKEGNERFIQPEPPEGWLYDEKTGTFYPEDGAPNEEPPNLYEENKKLRAQVAMMQEQQTFLEDCLLDMADVVYA